MGTTASGSCVDINFTLLHHKTRVDKTNFTEIFKKKHGYLSSEYTFCGLVALRYSALSKPKWSEALATLKNKILCACATQPTKGRHIVQFIRAHLGLEWLVKVPGSWKKRHGKCHCFYTYNFLHLQLTNQPFWSVTDSQSGCMPLDNALFQTEVNSDNTH